MKAIRLIARREWLATICSPTGLIIVGLYLVVSGYVFWLNVSMTQEATLRYTFASLGMLTAFVIPLITMRLLSEEFRSGTFETLTSHPVSDLQIVLGKFLAGYVAFLSLSVPTLAYMLILQVLGSPDWGPALCAYLGQQLLAIMLLALGLLASSLTANQVLAAMAAMLGGIALWLAGTASSSIEGWVGQALAYLSMFDHLSIFRRGVIDTRAVAYFVTTAVMFLYLAVRAIESRRWKFGVVPAATSIQPRLRGLSILLMLIAAVLLCEAVMSYFLHGLWSTRDSVLILLAAVAGGTPLYLNRFRIRYELSRRRMGLVITVVVNCLLVVTIWGLATYFTSRHYVRADLTSSKHYALSPQTIKVLDQLESPVEVIVAMGPPVDLHQEITDLLAEYTAHSPRLTVREIDPIRNPGDIDQIKDRFKLTSAPSNELLIAMGDQVRRLPVRALVHQRATMREDRTVARTWQFVGEAELTGALIQLTRKAPGRIVFLAGHGERSLEERGDGGVSAIAAELQRNGWIVSQHIVTPGANASVPADTSILVVPGPQKKLADEDLHAINEVLDRGGGVLMLIDPGVAIGADAFLQNWNVHLDNNIVVDLQDHLAAGDPTSLYVTHFQQDHPIGKGMGSLAAVLPTTRRIAPTPQNANVFPHIFMYTSGDGWAIAYEPGTKLHLDRNRDKRGSFSLGMACERAQEFPDPGHSPLQGRLVVIGDSDFVTNRYLDMAGNQNLFLNCVDWLAGRQDLISVRPKTEDARYMVLTAVQKKTVLWLSVFILPGLTMLSGVVMIARRRYQA